VLLYPVSFESVQYGTFGNMYFVLPVDILSIFHSSSCFCLVEV